MLPPDNEGGGTDPSITNIHIFFGIYLLLYFLFRSRANFPPVMSKPDDYIANFFCPSRFFFKFIDGGACVHFFSSEARNI